ncbi:hypothetical protein [Microcoleus sp. OTE_8_concoct_300]|uniref:hypothetical protein n=1 Tax=Microcoleus sp. OTE_8_concoct_300 TaxID=2964710 RepID=UPI00403EFABA
MEQACCLFLRFTVGWGRVVDWDLPLGGRDAHPTRKFILCGTGILPVLVGHPTRKFILCGTGKMPVLAIYRWVGVGFQDDWF